MRRFWRERRGAVEWGAIFMKNNNYGWEQRFRELYDKALVKYRNEHRALGTFFTTREVGVLAAFGAKPIELFHYAEDSSDLDPETALLITAARRDYFLTVQGGQWSEKRVKVEDLPAKEAKLEGIVWLPRLLAKAQARLRGELPDDIMYGCGGDRKFFRTHDIHPADFLRTVWATKGNEEKVLAYVTGKR